MRKTLLGWGGVAVLLGLLVSGCSRSRTDRWPTYPVTGRLFVGEKPAAGARVKLSAVEDKKLAGLCPHALVEPDGTFRLTTYKTGDGAPAGNYALTVSWPLPPPPGKEEGADRFRGRYANPRWPVRQVQVVAGENDLGRVDIP